MKKLVCAVLMLGLAFALVGCGDPPDPPPTAHEQINELLNQVVHYLRRSEEALQTRDQITEELRDNFDELLEDRREVLETRRIAANTIAAMNRNEAYRLAEEAMQIANEHGIDIIEMVQHRITRVPGIMELFE